MILLAYYGDDFTGSTDVLAALTASGVETMLFTEPPTASQLAEFPKLRAYGVAGNSRTMSLNEMDASLPSAFDSLRGSQPAIVHYKVCSTFDSSPTVGSIGRATEIGRRVFQNSCVPLVVGAPHLQRFCIFGNLFARSGLDSPVYRLDRHPTMSRHPVTPMNEADLAVHLFRQTSLPVQLVDVTGLDRGFEVASQAVDSAESIVLFDVLTEDHLALIGRLVWRLHVREGRPQFVVGSSGVEAALTIEWRAAGLIASESKGFPPLRPVDRAVVISGSCSPVTARQIKWALENGFADVPVDTLRLAELSEVDAVVDNVAEQAVAALDAGQSPLIHTSRGPDDPRSALTAQTTLDRLFGESLGVILGHILGAVLRSRRVERVAVAGGDTSGAVARSIGVDALKMVGPLAPGAPLCVAHSRHAEVAGVEFTFKGGQVGHDDFFGSLLAGGANAHR